MEEESINEEETSEVTDSDTDTEDDFVNGQGKYSTRYLIWWKVDTLLSSNWIFPYFKGMTIVRNADGGFQVHVAPGIDTQLGREFQELQNHLKSFLSASEENTRRFIRLTALGEFNGTTHRDIVEAARMCIDYSSTAEDILNQTSRNCRRFLDRLTAEAEVEEENEVEIVDQDPVPAPEIIEISDGEDDYRQTFTLKNLIVNIRCLPEDSVYLTRLRMQDNHQLRRSARCKQAKKL